MLLDSTFDLIEQYHICSLEACTAFREEIKPMVELGLFADVGGVCGFPNPDRHFAGLLSNCSELRGYVTQPLVELSGIGNFRGPIDTGDAFDDLVWSVWLTTRR